MTGAVDVSPFASLRLSDDERADLDDRARQASVLLTVTATGQLNGTQQYFATIAGRGRAGSAYGTTPYQAGVRAFAIENGDTVPAELRS